MSIIATTTAFATIVNLLCLYMAERRSIGTDKASEQVDFIEWLNIKGFQDVAVQMEFLIAQNQQLHDITEQNHKELLVRLAELKAMVDGISSSDKKVEFEVTLRVEQTGYPASQDGKYDGFLVKVTPCVKNLSSNALREFCLETFVHSEMNFSTMQGEAFIYSQRKPDQSLCYKLNAVPTVPLFQLQSFTCYSYCFDVTKDVLNEFNNTIVAAIFKWDGGFHPVQFNLKDYVKTEGRGIEASMLRDSHEISLSDVIQAKRRLESDRNQ